MRAGKDTAKGKHHDEEEVEDAAGKVGARKAGNQHVFEGTGHHKECPNEEKGGDATLMDLIGPLGIAIEADRKIPKDEGEH